MAVVRYAAGIVEWTRKELQIMDGRSTSKMCLQSVECVKKGMGQLAVLYRNARKLVQKQHRCWRHDKVARVIHWKLCGKLGYDRHATILQS